MEDEKYSILLGSLKGREHSDRRILSNRILIRGGLL
jgi:hypothetical protein